MHPKVQRRFQDWEVDGGLSPFKEAEGVTEEGWWRWGRWRQQVWELRRQTGPQPGAGTKPCQESPDGWKRVAIRSLLTSSRAGRLQLHGDEAGQRTSGGPCPAGAHPPPRSHAGEAAFQCSCFPLRPCESDCARPQGHRRGDRRLRTGPFLPSQGRAARPPTHLRPFSSPMRSQVLSASGGSGRGAQRQPVRNPVRLGGSRRPAEAADRRPDAMAPQGQWPGGLPNRGLSLGG